MEPCAAPVVNSPDKKLSRMEARREKLLVLIERAERTFEKHDKAAKRWLKRLAVMNGKRRRADKAIAKAKAEAANALVEPTKPEPPPAVETDHLPEPEFEKLAEKMADEAVDRLKANGTKRKRKSKAATVAQAASELAHSDVPRLSAMFPFGTHTKLSEADREKAVQLAEQKRGERTKRMKAMGFRPTKR